MKASTATPALCNVWVRTTDRLPCLPGEQADILMWSPEWATWLKGLVTVWGAGIAEWAMYDQQNDRYHAFEHVPEYWMRVSTAPLAWREEPPDTVGAWWLYGEVEFGSMGGHYSGSIPMVARLHHVQVMTLGSGEAAQLYGKCDGRLINLQRFSHGERRVGCVGLWRKVDEVPLPEFTYRKEEYP